MCTLALKNPMYTIYIYKIYINKHTIYFLKSLLVDRCELSKSFLKLYLCLSVVISYINDSFSCSYHVHCT